MIEPGAGLELHRPRGRYAGIHEAILDDPEFRCLPPEARHLWFTLRLMLGASGIDRIRVPSATLQELTGWDADAIAMGCRSLAHGSWLLVQGHVFWLRNVLAFNPTTNLSNQNHRKSVQNHLAGLPKLFIVNAFADYYGLKRPFPNVPEDSWDADPMAMVYPIQNQNTESETGDRSARKGVPHSATQDDVATAVGRFCEEVGCEWSINATIPEWSREIQREPKYAGVDFAYEIRRCSEWHQSKGKVPSAPDRSIRNWLERAASDAQGNGKGPNRNSGPQYQSRRELL